MPGREIHVSENGDRWDLLRDPQTGQAFVRHSANRPSGGAVTDIALAAFLGPGRNGPEHQALWDLIGSLIDQAEAGSRPTASA